MKSITPLLFVVFLMLLSSCHKEVKSNLALLDYQLPLDSALVFAKDIVSTEDFEFAITFSPEMDEVFFTRRKHEGDNEIYSMRLTEDQWSTPELAFFSPEQGWDFEPHINPAGDRLYFGSTRPLSDTSKASGMHQWVSRKEANGWTEPEPLGAPFVDRFTMYISSTENGNLYYTSAEAGAPPQDGGIYYSVLEKNQYSDAQRMNEQINAGEWIAHPYIAPDESYMIYDGERSDGYGDCDLYISFYKDGSWTEPVNLGPEVNTEQCEMCSSVSPDGKYLFFHRGVYSEEDRSVGDIYWIDFKRVLERIKNDSN